jgi:hypothetical protein
MAGREKLFEVALLLSTMTKALAREKSARDGHPHTRWQFCKDENTMVSPARDHESDGRCAKETVRDCTLICTPDVHALAA